MPTYKGELFKTVLPWGDWDPMVTATQRYSQIQGDYLTMLENFEFKDPSLKVPDHWKISPHILLPLGGRTAIEKRKSIGDAPSSPHFLQLVEKATKMLLLEKPVDDVAVRRSSGVGFSGDATIDKMAREDRETLFSSKRIYDFKAINKSKLESHVFYRKEPKAKKVKTVYTYTGSRAMWSHVSKQVFDDIGEYTFADGALGLAPWRPRVFYIHPYPNLLIACLVQLFDGSKYNKCTCPTLEVPVATTLSSELQRYCNHAHNAKIINIATGDVARMTTAVPGDCLSRIWDTVSDRVAAWAGVEVGHIRRWFDLFYPINRVRFNDDTVYPMGDSSESVDNVVVGNPDGVAGTTFNNDCIVLAWIMLLFEQLKLPIFSSIHELADHPALTFRWIGDTVLVASNAYDARTLLTKFAEIVRNNSIDGDFTIDDSPLDPWCGYCLARDQAGRPNGTIYSSEMSSLKIFVPEYEADDDHWRPNPRRGFEDALAKFCNIPQDIRLLKPSAIKAYQDFYNSLDLNFPPPKCPEADIEVFFYHPAYMKKELPKEYFLHISSSSIKEGLNYVR